ncbi:arad-like aldolase/epimerase [Gloeophyllum trabeum ATCC 11539]|uniref:Arad-like aldolase/epimerase n=1 Tax=Gloeophyllum trabeum (strain ATCC 11539 / FP-39264 / Madison 617) TaxID=670483 RepID=S7QGM8_GLOTA|nr:arad-like aldolase/epimerase [Gloeophyllum trabeum ATCC 11539]EPQ58358.1 arad-like aldolase/epimerase [Gloeophyllum trabeum ATCC 11539]
MTATSAQQDSGGLSKSAWPKPPAFSSKVDEREFLKFRLAQAFRIFGKQGYDEGIAGHITVRDPIKPDCFWVNPYGVHFKQIQPSDLLLVDHDGNVLDESGPNRILNEAAFMIHSAIHRRPDVMCAAHTHSIYGRAYCALGKELDIITQDSCAFYNDHAVYTQFNGLVLDKEEGAHIATALGNKKNHGLLVATDSIEATVSFYMSLERCCQVQLLADAAAAGRGQDTLKIPEEQAYDTWKKTGNGRVGWFAAQPEFALLEATEGVKFKFQAKVE